MQLGTGMGIVGRTNFTCMYRRDVATVFYFPGSDSIQEYLNSVRTLQVQRLDVSLLHVDAKAYSGGNQDGLVLF